MDPRPPETTNAGRPAPAGGLGEGDGVDGATDRRVGRPSKPPSERRTRKLQVLLKPREAAAVKRAAAGAGLSVSAYARRRVLGLAVAPAAIGEAMSRARDGLDRSAAELGRVGSDLNQLARWANAGVPTEQAAPFGTAPPEAGQAVEPGGPAAADWAALAAEVLASVRAVRAASEAVARAADGGDGRVGAGGPTYVRPDFGGPS